MDELEFSEIKKRANDLQTHYVERNKLYDELENIFFLNWEEEAKFKRANENAKITLSPDPRNKMIGAARLLTASDPVFSVPGELNEPDVQAESENLEKFAQKMWQAAGKVAGTPIHYDGALSAMLYGEIHIAITSTQDLLKAAGSKSNALKARAERVAKRTPYLFEIWNPKECFTEFDGMGLTTHFRRSITTKRKVWTEFGEDAEKAVPGKGYEECVLCEWWDLENHIIWVEGTDTPIVDEAHELSYIPIVVGVTDGSKSLFTKPEEQRQPFLYAVYKSGLWNRQNLSLSVMFTMLHGLGANAMFLYEAQDPDSEPERDFSVPGGEIRIKVGEKYGPLAKQLVDPNLWQAMEVADGLTAESTIYEQTLGEPLGKNAPYSMVALLSQAGRLPLVSPQRILGWAIGTAVEIAMTWLKEDNQTASARYGGDVLELEPAQIPDEFEIEAALDVSLPQDDLQSANVANQLTEGDDPLVSQEWVLKNVLKVEQPNEMKYRIWAEKSANMRFMQYMAHQLAIVQQKMQQAMTPPMPPELPPEEQAAPPPAGAEMPLEEAPPGPEGAPIQGIPQAMEEGGQAPLRRPPNQPPPEGLV
jgi:hypothetical protein